MSVVQLFDTPVVHAIAQALLHSLWQGALIAAVLFATRQTFIRAAANVRYVLACIALVAMLAAPAVTAVLSYEPGPRTSALPAFGPPAVVAEPGVQPPSLAPPSEAPVVAASPLMPRRYLVFVVAAWLLGVAFCALRLAADSVRLRVLLRSAEPAPDVWQVRLDRMARKMGVPRMVTLLQSAKVKAPCAARFLRPVVIAPVSVFTALSARDLEMIIAHELAHIRRHDFFVNLLQRVAESLLFFNPAARWVSAVIRVERENCCDDAAVLATGNKLGYARALTELAALSATPDLRGAVMSAAGGSLGDRVRRLVLPSSSSGGARWVAGITALLLVSTLAVAAPLSVIEAGSPKTPPPPPTVPEGIMPPAALEALSQIVPAPQPLPIPIPSAMAQPPEPNVKVKIKEERKHERKERAERRTSDGELSVDELVGLRVAKITPEYVESLRGVGLDPDVETLVALGHARVTADYVTQMREVFGPEVEVDDLVSMAHVGVTPEFVQGLRSAGFNPIEAEDAISARAVGVSPAYLKQMKEAGVPLTSLEDVAGMRAVGVTPEYVRELKSAGYDVKSVDELTTMRAVGVSPEYIQSLRDAGLKNLTIDDLVQLKATGVDRTFLRDADKLKKKRQ